MNLRLAFGYAGLAVRGALPVGAALALVLFGCNARVDEFSATAHYICPGQRVELSWRVSGNANVSARPPLAALPDGAVSSEGQATIAPKATTVVELHVTRWLGKPTSSLQTINVDQSNATPKPLTVSIGDPSAKCGAEGVSATVHPKRFSDDIKVATVAAHSGDPRSYDVEHRGVHARVAPGQSSTAFAGTPITGDWVLTSPLQPGEACGTPTLPHNLVVDVFTQCVPGAHP